jgi:hypothetical protein
MFLYSILTKQSQELEELEKRNGVRKALSSEAVSKAIADVNRKIAASIQSFMVSRCAAGQHESLTLTKTSKG